MEDEVLNKVLRESADLLPYRGGKAWQGDSVDGNSASNQKKSALKKVNDKKMNKRKNSSTSNKKKLAPKKVSDKKMNKRNNSKSDDLGEVNNTTFKCDNNDEDVSIFNYICGNFLKKKVAKNVKSSMKTDIVDIFITGSFRNAKTGKSYWIVVCGDYGSAWTLKSQFMKGYIVTLLSKIKKANYRHWSLQFLLRHQHPQI